MTRKIQALIFRTSFIFGILALCSNLLGQDGANPVDIAVRFNTDVPPEVKINQVFGIQAEVYLEANSSTIPVGETVVADAYLIDPSGIIIQEHSQEWNGFNEETDGLLENTAINGSLLFQVPWSQASKWSASARWTVSVRLTASSIESNMTNNLINQSFSLLIPDLQNVVTEVTATDPINGGQTTSYIPNTNYTVSGTITNLGSVSTQPSVHVAVRARLHKLNPIAEGQYDLGEIIDEESIVFPEVDDPLLSLPAGGSYNYKIENLFLPADAEGEYVVIVEVNPGDIIGGSIMFEQNFANNWDVHPATPNDTNGDGQTDFYTAPYIDVRPNEANGTSFPNLEFVPNSYKGETGTFRGLEPAFISFAIRNNGQRPVSGSDEISARVLLSKDLQADPSDFVLREFNLGGSGIGQGMLAGETINLTWFQQLPDNFEGDYYLIVEIVNLSSTTLYYADQTPTFTLISEDKGSTDLVPTNSGAAERPSTSEDGRYVVYEKTETHLNGQAYQQIYLLDMQSPSMNPVLISKSYSDITGQLPANNSSLRPRISLDGSTIVFHSRASDLVPGDSNGKEDIFLYRVATNTLLRAVNENDQQLNGRSLYADVNGDGSRVVFESDATNADLNSSRNTGGKEIYLWDLGESTGGTITALTKGNGNSYNPSIDESGMRIVFDSFATNIFADEKYIVGDEGQEFSGQTGIDSSFITNGLRHVYALDLEPESRESADKAQIYLVNLNYNFQEAEGGASMNPRISGNGQRIVFESKAQNLVTGAGIAKVVVTEGGAGYEGSPTIEIIDEIGEDDLNASGAPGSGVVFAMREDGINALNEIKSDAILVINPGSGYVNPRVRIIPDPSYPEPLLEAKATAYLANPEGDIYFVDWNDLDGTTFGEGDIPSFSKRVSEAVKTQTGGNFGSREPDISKDGSKIVYSTKSSNLLPDEFGRDDGATFYNSNFLLPTAQAILVGPIQEIEIANNGSGYQSGFFNIEDLSGAGFGAQASFEVDQRGRIVSITIINPGQNYRLETTRVTVAEPLGGSGFVAGELRFPPTQGLGETRTGGGRIFKVEMTDYGLGYKITDDGTGSFADLIQFEGDGADLNSDGFPDGRINPDRVHSKDGSLFLEQKFNVEVISLGADLMSTSLTVSDKNSSLEPLTIEFDTTSGSSLNSRTINIFGLSLDGVRNAIVDEIVDYLNIPSANKISSTADILKGSIIDENATNGTSFTFSALSGRFTSSNPSAIKVTEQSNMLVMGSGYTIVTPVVNQVPSIFGLSEVESNPSYELSSGVGRMTLLAKEDQDSDDIYLYDIDLGTNSRISTSSFGTPAAYIPNEGGTLPSPPSNRFPSISANGRFVFFSSDSWGSEGLAFLDSNQKPKVTSAARNIYYRDLKSAVVAEPTASLVMRYPSSDLDHSFAPKSNIPIIADLNFSGDYLGVGMILNQTLIDYMDEFGGGIQGNFQSGRFTSTIRNLESGEYTLQLVAYGLGGEILASSSIRRFNVSSYDGSLPPSAQLIYPSSLTAVTSTSVVPVQVSAIDSDGTVEKVSYYIDGVLERTIERIQGVSQGNQTYSHLIDVQSTLNSYEEQGVKSIFAVAEDNSGNYVATNIGNFSFTKGSNKIANISIKSGVLGFDLNSSDLNVSISGGAVSSIKLVNGVVGSELLSARLELSNDGNGTGALLEPILQTDPNLPNYGRITGVNVTSGGSNYNSNEKFSIKIIPILRVVNEGVPASLFVSTSTPTDPNATTFSASATLNENVDGSLKSGSGYVISPLLRLYGYSFLGLSRVPLVQTTNPTSSLEDFSVSVNVAIGSTGRTGLFGGFTQAPVIISVEANATDEVINSVSLVINGQVSDDYILYHPTINNLYNFTWVPEDPGEYSIYALVKDNAGNVSSTPENVVSVENYQGSGIGASFSAENDYVVESNGQLVLAAEATSEYGVSEVEFYIDNISVGKAFSNGGSSFQINVNFEDYNFRQGVHEVSLIARDALGNSAGTFPVTLTNLESRLNRTLTLLPPIIKNPPSVVLQSPETEQTITVGSSIRLHADANDSNGDLIGVQYFLNQNLLNAWSGYLDFNNTLPQDGEIITIDDGTGKDAVTFEFDDNLSVFGSGAPYALADSSNLLSDLTVEGNFTFAHEVDFVVEIDRTGSTDTFRWSKDGGKSFVDEFVEIDESSQPLAHGLMVRFESSSGHALGDRWIFTAKPQNQVVDIFDQSGTNEVNVKATRDALARAISDAYENGILSMRTWLDASNDLLYLAHAFDRQIISEIDISGTALTPPEGTGTIDLNYTDGLEDYVLPYARDGRKSQPFGMTWEANETGTFILFAIAEDSVGVRTTSVASVITVIDPIGEVPQITLEEMQKNISHSGNPLVQTLSATAYDPDGEIAEVTFYVNGIQVGEPDTASPYSVDWEVNATGHYDVYAIARDNVSNVTTSNVTRVIISESDEIPAEPITFTSSESMFLGGTDTISANYKAEDRIYDPDLRALVYLNGELLGLAEKLPYQVPESDENDPGHTFTYDLTGRSIGVEEIEFIVVNGTESVSASVEISVKASPFVDDLSFLIDLYQGLYARDPVGFEQAYWSQKLSMGTITRAQILEELTKRQEFQKAKDMMNAHKTVVGEWATISDILGASGSASGSTSDDHSDFEENATTVFFNQTINGRIDKESDIDWFRIQSLTPNGNDGILKITILPGHPRGMVIPDGLLNVYTPNGYLSRYGGLYGPWAAPWRDHDGMEFLFDLRNYTNVDDYTFYIEGTYFPAGELNDPYLGEYTMILENASALEGEQKLSQSMMERTEIIQSPVNNFSIFASPGNIGYANSLLNGSWYTDQYGAIGTHSPESYFRRIFINKYEQDPSPVQIIRGVNLLEDGNYSQLQFLENFALENEVISVGGYNFTQSDSGENHLAIPNVPLDPGAFSETALIYSALIGTAPSKSEVAKLTLTPDYEVRPVAERAQMIMELPAYGSRYGLSMPAVDFVAVQNGRPYDGSQNNIIRVDASSLGADNLAGTIDDGNIISVELFLNGTSAGKLNSLNGMFFYEFTLNADSLDGGEYLMEAVAEDANGLKSKASRTISMLYDDGPTIAITSPQIGDVLTRSSMLTFSYEASEDVTAYMEVDGQVRWVGAIAFEGTGLPLDESNFTFNDGTGRGDFVLEFDSNGSASSTTIESPEKMFSASSATLASGGTYLGTDAREYLVEIDTNGTVDTFRWSIDGGANFNDSLIQIPAGLVHTLSAGVSITFDDRTSYAVGDKWRIKAYPNNEIVEVARNGTFSQRLQQTKQNLIIAINRSGNLGKHFIRAIAAPTEETYDQNVPVPPNMLAANAILLANDRFLIDPDALPSTVTDFKYPVIEPITVSFNSTETTLTQESVLPLATTSSASATGNVYFNHGRYLGKNRSDMVRIRLIGYDIEGNAIYSTPVYFKLRDPHGPNISMSYPNGRPATIRVSDVDGVSGEILAFEIVDPGVGYTNEYPAELTIHSVSGAGAEVSAVTDSAGSITGITIIKGGLGYDTYDGVSASSPFRYYPGQEVKLSAIANDPYGEITSLFFSVNGVPLVDGNQTGMSLTGNYTPMNLVPLFFSVSGTNQSMSVGDWTKGWQPSWLLQHHHQGGLSAPQWYWGNSDYWPHPAPWQTMPLPPGATVAEVVRSNQAEIEIPNVDMLQNDENISFVVGSNISVLVDAESLGSDTSNIQLYANGMPVGLGSNMFADFNGTYLNTTSYLHELSWTPEVAGTYQLQWMAQDATGRFSGFSKPIAVKVNNAPSGGSAPPTTQIMSPQNMAFLTTSSSTYLTASASDPDFDLEKVQFFVNGQPVGDPIYTPVSGFADQFPYFQRWEPRQAGINIIHSVATDFSGSSVMSPAVSVIVGQRMGTPPKPRYEGIVKVAELIVDVNTTAGDGRLSISIDENNSGFGYISPPTVVIDNFGTNGSGLDINISDDLIEDTTGRILGLNIVSLGSGYTSAPRIRLEGGFPTIEASGTPGTARAESFTLTTTPDDQGNRRAPFGLNTIEVLQRGSGYLQPPDIMISHPTAEGAEAIATLRPAANGRQFEIDTITVTLQGGGRPIEFDANGSNPTSWTPGYDQRTSVTLVGGLPFDEATFEFAEPLFTDPNSTLSEVSFYAVGNGIHQALSSLSDNPFRWNWGSPQPGTYGLYAEILDSRGNLYASEIIYRKIQPASLPEGDFTSPYRAKGDVVIRDGEVIEIQLSSPGAIYNYPPDVVIDGDGSGATASAQIDPSTGMISGITITNPGSGYTSADVQFAKGWVTTQQVDEYVLGETISIGLTAFSTSAEIKEIRLIVNNTERDEITFPTLTSEPDFGGYEEDSQEFGDNTGQSSDANIQRLDRWKYDGTMPNYNIYFTPSDVGIYNLEAKIIDHTGYSTITSSYRVRVTNGEPPVIELMSPRTGESFALDYDRNQDIRLVAKAQDPDWQARFGGDSNLLDRRNELSRVWFFADDQFVGVGNRILGTDLYQFVWRPTVEGNYRITAIAVDDQVGDLNQNFGDIGRVGGTATSDPQYISISSRSGSRPPDVLMLHPSNPVLAPGFLNTELASNDAINLQPDNDPQLLANIYNEDQFLAAEYPNLYTSDSRDMVWAWADDRDGDLDSVQFYVNGANAVIQLRDNPAVDDVNISINGTVIEFDGSIVGATTVETAENLKDAIQLMGINAYLMPGAATIYEKSTVLINFDDTSEQGNASNLSSTDESNEFVFTWVFREIPAEPGEYPLFPETVHASAYSLMGDGGTYFAHPFVPGLNGIFSAYAVATDTSGNRVMSIPSYYKSTTGTPKGYGRVKLDGTYEDMLGNTKAEIGETFTLSAKAESNYSIEYIEFFDNGHSFGAPPSRVDQNGVYHPGLHVLYDDKTIFTVDWNASELGEHLLYARFTDIKGNSFISEPLRILVDKTPAQDNTPYTGYTGGFTTIEHNFVAPDGNYYDPVATIFIDGKYVGEVNATSRNDQEIDFWDEDPGYDFSFSFYNQHSGTFEIKWFITNGDNTHLVTRELIVSESLMSNERDFLIGLWKGLFDREPKNAEINPYIGALRNGTMNRAEVIAHISSYQEFINARNHMLVYKTLHGRWGSLPGVLAQTDQVGLGKGNGNENNNFSVEAATGMPFGPVENNATDFGFYTGVEDDHSNMISGASIIGMNETDYITILSYPSDIDYFRIRSQNLADEGILRITLNRNIAGGIVASNLGLNDFDINGFRVLHLDGTYSEMTPIDRSINDSWINSDYIVFDLNQYNNVDSYIFPISHFGSLYNNRPYLIGGVSITIQNDAYLDQANFLTDEDIDQMEIESKINDFNYAQAINFQVNEFSYRNQYGQIETHDPSSFFQRLFVNKYDQFPNPMQANRGIRLLSDGRQQVQFLQDFALENNIITVGGYNYTTSQAELAIPNVPIDAAAFAETALVYSALLDKAPSNAEVARLTLNPYFEVQPLAERARLIMEMPEYSSRYNISTPQVSILSLQNGDVLKDDQIIVVEAFDNGLDGSFDTADDNAIRSVSLLFNGTTYQQLEGNKSTTEYNFDLGNGLPQGEYTMEVVAENMSGQTRRTAKQVFVGADTTDISLTSPAYGSVLKKGEPIEVGYSLHSGLSGQRFLEINGGIRWSGVLSMEDYLLADGVTISLIDGTGRNSVSFEFDNNDSASSYTIQAKEIRKFGDGNLTLHGNYNGPAEGTEYLIAIDSIANGANTSASFSWRELGYIQNEDNGSEIIIANKNYSLGHNLEIKFDSNTSFAFGDTWRVKVEPKYIGNLNYNTGGTDEFVFESDVSRVEIETDGTYLERIARTKRNLIHAINMANSQGLTAISAYDPIAESRLSGMLPFGISADRAIVLRHDNSYPITTNVEVLGFENEDVQDLFPLITANSGNSLTLSQWDTWEMRDGLLEFRVVLVDALGNVSYSDKRTYPLVDPVRGYVELIGPLGTVYEPGRLPTVHFADGFTGPSALPTTSSGITIIDGGAGYRWFDQQEPGFQIVSSTGYNGSLRIQSVGSSVGAIYDAYADSGSAGYGYRETDVIVPNPPALFDKNQNIDVTARLYDPFEGFERVAFYLNGVELDSTVQDRSGGRFGTIFSTDSAGDKFLTARALYGDVRDRGPEAPQPFGYFGQEGSSYGGKDHWGWKKSWLQQHYSTGQEFLPTWFNELHEHWIHPNNWARQAMWDGAAPIRIENKDIYESVSIIINSNSPALLVNELLHSQSTEIYVTADWAQGNVPFTEVHLYGNDQQIAQLDVANNNPFSNRLQWTFEWFVNFKQFKDDFGLVDLKVVGITEEGRQITSPLKRVYIRELSLTDPKSTLAMFWMDITGEILNFWRLEEILGVVNTSSIQSIIDSIVDYINQEEYQYMADLISAYQALYGEYHSSSVTFYGHYNLWSEQIRNNRSVGLLAYITDQVSSNKYFNKYGVIPDDKPYFFGTVEGINFNNRRDFVVRHWLNKYGTQPTVMQYMSGAKKMWDYAGGSAAATNYAMNRMAAADFVFNLTTEPTVKYGITGSITQPYISGMGSNTNRSFFLDRAKQYALGNAGSFANVFEDVMQASVSTSQKMVEEVAEDPALIRRFNLLWEDSTSLAFDYWKYEEWFGHFMDEKYPWIYHVDLGWLYSHGTSQRNIWFYSETMGWFWTNREIFTDHPNLNADNQRFIYRVRPSATGGWEGSWSLVTLPTSDGGSSVIELYDYGYYPF